MPLNTFAFGQVNTFYFGCNKGNLFLKFPDNVESYHILSTSGIAPSNDSVSVSRDERADSCQIANSLLQVIVKVRLCHACVIQCHIVSLFFPLCCITKVVRCGITVPVQRQTLLFIANMTVHP